MCLKKYWWGAGRPCHNTWDDGLYSPEKNRLKTNNSKKNNYQNKFFFLKCTHTHVYRWGEKKYQNIYALATIKKCRYLTGLGKLKSLKKFERYLLHFLSSSISVV